MHEGWSDWERLEPLSSGASGVVYRACRRGYPEYQSAIKEINIPPDKEETEELRQAGMSEEQIRDLYQRRTDRTVAGIRRMERFKGMSNLVSIEDFRVEPAEGGTGSRVYVRMEYLKPLPAYLADKRMEENEIIRMGIDLCKALEILHGSGVIHQDIKPDNIFVNDRLPNDIIFKLGDLDTMREISNPAESEEIRGTPSYLAPEILTGQMPNERTDLYELGLTLYQIVNDNRLPFLPGRQFSSHHDLEIATQMRLTGTELPSAAKASEALSEILRKACAFQPEERYSSATEMRVALEGLLEEHRPVGSEEKETESAPEKIKPRSVEQSKKSVRKTGAVIAAVILLTGALFAVVPRKNRRDSGTATGTTLPAEQEETTDPSAGDPLSARILALCRQIEEKGILPDNQGFHMPVSLATLPALGELDDYLTQAGGTWPPEINCLEPTALEGEHACEWQDGARRKMLEVNYQMETGAIMRWNLSVLLEDRANGWSVTRELEGKGGWRLRWNPPLKTSVIAEYTSAGILSAITRGKERYETGDTLPKIKGVEYLP